MAHNVSHNNLNNLLGATPAVNNAAANLPPLPSATAAPTLSNDSVTLSATANTAATTAANPDVKAELLRLRQELVAINKQIDALLGSLEGAPAAPTEPAPKPTPKPTPAPTPAPKPQAGGNYEVKAGDYLWKIAKEKLGDASRWKELYELNKDVIGDNPNLVFPGQKLKLPGGAQQPTPPTPPATPTPPTTPTPPVTPPATPAPTAGTPDVPPVPASNRPLSDQDVASIAKEFGLAPDRANVVAFLDEMDSYETAHKGKVFGPGMESLAANAEEAGRIKQSVMQLQQAFGLLIQAGKLMPVLSNGQPVTQLAQTGSFFKLDAQGQPLKDANGNPQMDEGFIAAITQFKQDNGVHQGYTLADGSAAINEYVGPGTVAALQKALASFQR